jgi:hypothetical protein
MGAICLLMLLFSKVITSIASLLYVLCPQVQSELAVVDKTNAQVQSFARVNFVDACEAAINEQIK